MRRSFDTSDPRPSLVASVALVAAIVIIIAAVGGVF